MRTNIDIDERLIRSAMRKSGSGTKKAVLDAALRSLVQVHNQIGIRKLRGKVKWEGDLEESRTNRFPE